MPIVAVTGANGFIGQRVMRCFAGAGWDARAVTRPDFEGAGQLAERFDGAEVVVHAAGATRAPNTAQLHDSNVTLTARTIEAARHAGVGRFVLISSQAAAGPAQTRDVAVTERTDPAPVEAYGRSKLEAERLVQSAAGLPFVILRPAAVYGPGDRDFLAMFRLARWGVAIHPGNRSQWVSIVHVDDVAAAIVLASTTLRALGGTFFIANDEPVQWDQLFREGASCASRTLSIDVQVPTSIVKVGARLGDVVARATGRAGLLTSEKITLSEAPYWICSNATAKRELEFSPAISLHDGLRETYDWYLAHDWL